MRWAADGGHLDTFLYLLGHGTGGFSSYEIRDAQEIQVLRHINPDVRGTRRSNRATNDQLKMLQTVFERQPAFVQDSLQCLARVACRTSNVAILDWVNQFGIEVRCTEPLRIAVRDNDVNFLQWFYENGFKATDPKLLELAAQRRCLEMIRWLFEQGHDGNSLKLIEFGYNIPIIRAPHNAM